LVNSASNSKSNQPKNIPKISIQTWSTQQQALTAACPNKNTPHKTAIKDGQRRDSKEQSLLRTCGDKEASEDLYPNNEGEMCE